MCPACLAATLPVLAGAVSGSVALAFVAKRIRDKHRNRETSMATIGTTSPKVATKKEWLEARKALLIQEKEHTRQQDELARRRRELPWVKVDKRYVFDTSEGPKSLADLFGDKSQLLIYHFMFSPEWDEGCKSCSFLADHIDGANWHLPQRDVRLLAISRAPLAKIEAFKKRMGWYFKWVSSAGSDFNFDYHVSFTPEEMASGEVMYNYRKEKPVSDELSGISVFIKNAAGEIFHTYSAFGRGAEELLGAYMLLDLTPKGRNETGPNFNLTDWVRHHDRYGAGGHVDHTGRFQEGISESCCEGHGK
jgi:predicted dithiol-disulfide oxidoreductase (DUF899 family)